MGMSGLVDRMRFRRDHRWAPARMSDYLDAELAPGARARIEHHLGECAECRRLLAGLRRTLDALHRLSPPSGSVAPAGLAASVRAQLGEPG
jgi:anti-sigma factor RsiW